MKSQSSRKREGKRKSFLVYIEGTTCRLLRGSHLCECPGVCLPVDPPAVLECLPCKPSSSLEHLLVNNRHVFVCSAANTAASLKQVTFLMGQLIILNYNNCESYFAYSSNMIDNTWANVM